MPRPVSQPDLFATPEPDLFVGHEPPAERRSYAPSPAWVRAYLRKVMDEARGASAMPWDDRKARFYRKVVPQMVRWLPDEEAERIRLWFEREMERLEAA